jgi:small subunit ribosomal protein S17
MKVIVLNIIDGNTFKAISSTYQKHPRYGKYITTHKKYLVDSAGKEIKIFEEVNIIASKPISKCKRWALLK